MREAVCRPGHLRPLSPGQLRAGTLEVTATLFVGVLLAAIGPYGTFGQARISERLVYWIVVVSIAFAIYRPSCVLGAAAAERVGLPAGFGWAAGVVLASFPLTLLVWLASYRHTPSLWPSAAEYVSFYGSVILIGAGLMFVIWLVDRAMSERQVSRSSDPTQAADSEADAPSSARLLERLPLELRSKLLALEMEDHYVRVHTSKGTALLLLRMRDAVAELEGLEGAQVHRSWWVARDAVERVQRNGRRSLITVENGLRIPVSRERRESLPGWLADKL